MHHRKRQSKPLLVAIVGPSGSGKSWLGKQLQARLAKEAVVVAQDDFYRDRSHLSPARRAMLNFDHPRATDWESLQQVLQRICRGETCQVPRYDFAGHCRLPGYRVCRPKPVVLLEGLWLLRRPSVRRLFALRIYISCSDRLALRRRLERDRQERGRTDRSVREQFLNRVAPMARRYVLPQARWADLIVKAPLTGGAVDELLERIQRLRDFGN